MSKILPFVGKIKEICIQKGNLNNNPPNGVEAVVITEQNIQGQYTASVAVGNISSINVRYFEVRGKVYDDTFNRFADNILKIEPKVIASTKGLEFSCIVFESGLIRAVDEASWADKFTTLKDLIDVLENL